MLTPDTDTTDDQAQRYYESLHKRCPILRRQRLECIWSPSGYCRHCGRPIPTLRPNQPGTMT